MTKNLLDRDAPSDLAADVRADVPAAVTAHVPAAVRADVADDLEREFAAVDPADPTALPATGDGAESVDEHRLHSEIAGALMSIVRQYSGIKARLADTPEGEMHLSVLLAKVSAHGPLRASDLADRICADPSTVSRQVAALVKGGFLERRADPDDGRASLLVVTEPGRARLTEHEVRRGLATAPVLAGWSLHDRTELLRLVGRYAADLHQHRDEIVGLLAGGAPTDRSSPGTGSPVSPTPPVPQHLSSSVAPAVAPTRSTGTEEDR